MQELLIAFTALAASMLTFFSGFGLGTILTPAFLLFFPVDVAIALTGIVHLLNNIFKLGLIGKNINFPVLIKFGVPAIVGSFLGAKALFYLSGYELNYEYELFGSIHQVTLVKLVIAVLLFSFAVMELLPQTQKLEFKSAALVPGGILSGFFGGLSGNQGALRSAFLINCGLSKEAFIATGVAIACVVDITRLPVYFSGISFDNVANNSNILLIAVFSAFIGAFIGKKLLKKITLKTVQVVVAVMICMLAVALGLGLI